MARGPTDRLDRRVVSWDRDALVAAVDLGKLADELLGPHSGRARSRTWPCPSPDHTQTGRTPPVTVFIARSGEERWHCHGCGNHGTAVDLVMQVRGVDVRGALDDLARRADISGVQLQAIDGRAGSTRRESKTREPVRPFVPQSVPVLEAYVAKCAEALWTPRAAHVRRWLTDVRHLPEDVLRTNRVGADLGVGRQPRPDQGCAEVRCVGL